MVPNNPEYKNYCKLFIELVNEKRISVNRLDDAVRRILRVKSHLGLLNKTRIPFSNDYTDFGSEKHKKASYNAASESITLLKNKGLLPLSTENKILLIGPTANSLNCLNGAWTHTWQGVDESYNNDYPTIKDVIEDRFNKVNYFEGSKMIMKDGDEHDILSSDLQNAVNSAKYSDVAIVCLGELPSTERPGDIFTLDLPEQQQLIVKELSKTGIPIILVLVEGRPKIIREIEPLSDAILQAYLPGDQGANAIVDVLVGNVNPSGKLPYTYPRYNGVIMHYDHKQSELLNANTWEENYYNPQWDFGFGLSYTTFEYSNMKLSSKTINSDNELLISIDIKNTGNIIGKEVVQLYIRDHYATISPSLKKLKRFTKIELEPLEERTVSFTINNDDLKFYGKQNKWITEEGKFSVIVNNLSKDFNFKR